MKPVAALVVTVVSLGALGAAAPQLSVLPSLCLAGSLVGILPPDLDVIECQNGEFCSPLLPSVAEAILQALGMSDAPVDIGVRISILLGSVPVLR